MRTVGRLWGGGEKKAHASIAHKYEKREKCGFGNERLRTRSPRRFEELRIKGCQRSCSSALKEEKVLKGMGLANKNLFDY